MIQLDLLLDLLKVLGRIVTILPILLVIGLIMGKRAIGKLPVFDFLVVLVLGSVVGADIANPNVDHIHTIVAMIAIALLQKFIIRNKLRNRKLGKLLTFEPTVVVYNGEIVEKNIKSIHYSIDNILQMLRQKDVYHINDVELALIEANGLMSVKLKPEKEKITRGDLHLPYRGGGYDIPLIMDGTLQKDILERLDKNEEWLENQLRACGINSIENIFYGAITNQGDFHCSVKGKKVSNLPPIEN
ncbi:DUF421 domain-containing protein [Halobacillus halophilus]|uniref:DUF421 domain-containing protein n=1 Tax=Halobacillus halophilus TaxID=1570 RepID=UPI001CD80F80|nr:DUF421 domain-containing protein [Halobacillus halophilus]MCA1012311.1 DUF421 domain-containing protein [Halobacillus halophilus]